MSKNDGGAAFPAEITGDPGMSLRDWFAGMALQGIMAHGTNNVKYPAADAIRAFELADAMIARRDSK